MFTELPVTAVEDICFQGGGVLAPKGTNGVALVGLKPNRKRHYGLVPVKWDAHTKVFWAYKHKLFSPEDLERCITRLQEEALDLTIPTTSAEDFSFGHNLRMFRRARGLSQGALASRMREVCMERVSQTSISNWENRKDCPSGTFLEAAAAALDVPAFAFFIRLDCIKVEHCLQYIQGLREHVCDGQDER